MFKVNNKHTRTTPLASSGIFIVKFEHISHLALVLGSIVNFEHVMASWEDTHKKTQLRALDIVESQSKKMWLVSCIT